MKEIDQRKKIEKNRQKLGLATIKDNSEKNLEKTVNLRDSMTPCKKVCQMLEEKQPTNYFFLPVRRDGSDCKVRIEKY